MQKKAEIRTRVCDCVVRHIMLLLLLYCFNSDIILLHTYIYHSTSTPLANWTQIFTMVTNSLQGMRKAAFEPVSLFLVSSRIWSHPTNAGWPSWSRSPCSCSRNAASLAKTRWRSNQSLGQVRVKNNQFCVPHISPISQEVSQPIVNIAPCPVF